MNPSRFRVVQNEQPFHPSGVGELGRYFAEGNRDISRGLLHSMATESHRCLGQLRAQVAFTIMPRSRMCGPSRKGQPTFIVFQSCFHYNALMELSLLTSHGGSDSNCCALVSFLFNNCFKAAASNQPLRYVCVADE